MTGTERKVFQKYYPPDYDPSKLKRVKSAGGRGRNRQFVQRVMTPFNMQCNTCHEYIYKGKKFNMKRETAEGETYLSLKLFRFYFKCPNCLAEITFKTDLENCDYQMEHGATRLFEAFKLYKEAERAKEEQEEEDKKDPMKMLEKRTMMSRAEMEAMGNLEDLQEINRQKEGVNTDLYIDQTNPNLSIAEKIRLQEDADEAYVQALFSNKGKKRELIDEVVEEEEEAYIPGTSHSMNVKSEEVDEKPEFKAPVEPISKRKTDQKSLLSKLVVVKRSKPGIKQEPLDDSDAGPSTSGTTRVVPTPVQPSTSSGGASGLMGLAGYGSDSDSD
ncbi:unnamed protein product [Auanema sp. JU1783]|nr:unnamed protein product [Auanema sp. JU1783]